MTSVVYGRNAVLELLRSGTRQAARLAMWITLGLVGTALVMAWVMYFISP